MLVIVIRHFNMLLHTIQKAGMCSFMKLCKLPAYPSSPLCLPAPSDHLHETISKVIWLKASIANNDFKTFQTNAVQDEYHGFLEKQLWIELNKKKLNSRRCFPIPVYLGIVSLVKEILNLNTTPRLNKVKWIDARVSVCSGTSLTSSSSSSSSTSRMPESWSSAWLPPRPLLSVDAACSLLLRRPRKGLGFEETELSKERWSCAWKQKYTLINIITGTRAGPLSQWKLLWHPAFPATLSKRQEEKKGRRASGTTSEQQNFFWECRSSLLNQMFTGNHIKASAFKHRWQLDICYTYSLRQRGTNMKELKNTQRGK